MSELLREYQNLIHNRKKSEEYAYMLFGEDYYKGRNTAIMERSKKVYLEGYGGVSNPFAANHKIPSGYFKKIADQKVMYLLGNGVTFTQDEDGQQVEQLNAYFETSFDEMLLDAGTDAAKKAEAWLYFYKENGRLKGKLIPAEQIFPTYDDMGRLEQIIRQYKTNDKQVTLVYDKDGFSRYEKKLTDNKTEMVGRYGHYSSYTMQGGRRVGEPEQHSFNQVPFIPMYNNREKTSDLYDIKPIIDVLDILKSDFANNIDDMQEAFFVLKGYTGDEEHLREFIKQLKTIKAVPVSEDGGVTTHQMEIPTEARKALIEQLEKDLYGSAMAVDFKHLSGGSITNVMIKAQMLDLDLKTDRFENEVRRFVGKVIDFINANDNKNYSKEVMFDRSSIVNKKELTEMLVGTSGIASYLSREAVLELLPFDIDVSKELERIEEEKGEIRLEVMQERLEEQGED